VTPAHGTTAPSDYLLVCGEGRLKAFKESWAKLTIPALVIVRQ
jgi:hypothetical protein